MWKRRRQDARTSEQLSFAEGKNGIKRVTSFNTFSETALAGKVALVTGAGARDEEIGIGRAIALRLAQAGAKIVLVDAQLSSAERTEKMIVRAGGEAISVQANVASEEDCRRAVLKAAEHFGRLDILVNNVGIGGAPGNACDLDVELWDNGLRVNVTSMMLMARHSIPELRKQGGGAIVNMSSVAGIRGGHAFLNYATTKAAIVGMTYTMAEQHGRDLIRVNCICPGLLYTPIIADYGMTEDRRKMRMEASCLKTEGTAWDVADATLFLTSDAARWITGQVLAVDAGLTSLTNLVLPIDISKR